MSRSRTGRAALTVAMTALVLVAAVSGDSRDRVSAQTDPETSVGMILQRQSGWVGPEGTFTVVVDPRGLRPEHRLTFSLFSAVTDYRQFEATLTGSRLGSTLFRSSPASLTSLPRTTGGAIALTLPLSPRAPSPPGGAVVSSAGVHPFVIRVLDDRDQVVDELVTHLVRLPAQSVGTLAVAPVIRLEAPISLALDGSPFLRPEDRSRFERRLTALTALPSVPATLLPSPQTLQLAAQDESDESDELRGLPTLSNGRQIPAAFYAPVDLGAWVAASMDVGLDAQRRTGTEVLTELLGAPPDPGLAVLDPTITPDSLTWLALRGVDSVVVPSASLASTTDRTNPNTLTRSFAIGTGEGSSLRAVANDDRLTALLQPGPDPVLGAHNALAALAITRLGLATSGRGLTVVTPADVDPATLDAFLSGLADTTGADSGPPGAPLLSAVTLEQFFASVTEASGSGSTSAVRRELASVPAPSLDRYPERFDQLSASIDGLRSFIPTGAELIAPIERTLLSSGTASFDRRQRDEVLANSRRAVTALTDGIVIPAEFNVTLTSRSGVVPLDIENRLAVPATVRIDLRSAKLEFPSGSVMETVLPANSLTRVELNVTTRASGSFPLDISLSSPDGLTPIARTRFTVRSTSISGVGLALSLGAGLFLLFWWVRHLRSARRGRELVPLDRPEPTGESEADYAPSDTAPEGDR